MKAMTTLDDAEKIGYLVTRANNGRLCKSWWRRCKQHNKPYVVVNLTGRKWATVSMDLWSRAHALTTEQQDRLTLTLEAAARRAFDAGARGSIYASAGLDYASITKCRFEDAQALAETLLAAT